jgi:hypothetical protein
VRTENLLGRLAESAAFLPDEQRALLDELQALVTTAPPPAHLTATSRIGWVFASLSEDKASDFAGAIGMALMAGGVLSGHPADEAQRMAFAAVSEIAQAAARFVIEQRVAAVSTRH